jgi:FeS assembly SUF system protein
MALDWKSWFDRQDAAEEVSYDDVKAGVIERLRGVYDPEIPVNIYDLGLVYDILIDEKRKVRIRMTLTAPNCPVAQSFPQTVQDAVLEVPGVSEAEVELVWEPPWTRERMTEAARLQLGMF